MAQLIDITKVAISPRSLTATVRIADDAPLYTDEDPAGTDLVAGLMPQIASHACFGDGAVTFGDAMQSTEVAHLLEHVCVELLARTGKAGSISAGQTRVIDEAERLYEIRLACPDDVLVAGALSSAAWIVDWAYTGGGDPEPDVDAIASGLAALVDGLAEKPEEAAQEDEPVDPNATIMAPPIVVDEPEAVEVAEEPLDEPEEIEEAAEVEDAEASDLPEEPADEPYEQDLEDLAALEPAAEDALPEADEAPEPSEEDPREGEDIPAPRFVR